MNNIQCRISIECPIYPSEDLQKILHALSNVFTNLEFETSKRLVYADSDDIKCLEKIAESIRNKQFQKPFRKQFLQNTHNNSLWFYLNKQAAFADTIALCENEDESPLGPIKITIDSPQIEQIIEWLIHI